MNYQEFIAKDFAMDDSFQAWVINGKQEAADFWENWLRQHPEKAEEVERAKEILFALSHEKNVATAALQQEVWQQIEVALEKSEKKFFTRFFTLRNWYYVAAAVVFLMTAWAVLWTISQQERKVFYATRYGETRKIILPDQSEVMLNANSKLYYTKGWGDSPDKREVWLEGEAYFDVAHTDAKKFIVYTGQAAVEVLGTSFNVSERRGNTEVILSSGKVALHLEEEKHSMQAGDKVSYSSQSKKLVKRVVNPDVDTAWRNNLLIFDETPLSDIARILEDNYGYEVKMEHEEFGKQLFNGTIKADQLDLLLEAIAETHSLNIEKQKGRIYFRSR